MSESEMPLEILLDYLNKLAISSLNLWDIPDDCIVKLINVSENATYLVSNSSGFKAILRVHRENYHTERAIECELEWIANLSNKKSVKVPGHFIGKNNKPIQEAQIEGLKNKRYLVLFEFVEGIQPDENSELEKSFEELGEIAALTHVNSINWIKPKNFERLIWDANAVFGNNATWGDWRDGPNVTNKDKQILENAEAVVCRRLNNFGKSEERYGLIHADMRLANLLIDDNGTRLIDFDDCGFGWFLYDFAAAISFMEDDPRIPNLKSNWLKGYRKIRAISENDENEIETFIMLRRMALLAWVGSHIETPEASSLAPDFSKITVQIAENYLKKFS